MLSHDVYLHLLTRLDPGYKYAAWGSQANPVWPLVDVIPQYNAIKGGPGTHKPLPTFRRCVTRISPTSTSD